MRWFRSPRPTATPLRDAPGDPSAEGVRSAVRDVLRPAHFYVGPGRDLWVVHTPPEEVFWEIYRGRLLDPSQTRQRRSLESWSVFPVENGRPSPEPILSLKLDLAAGQVHVVRAIYSYVWEGYDAGNNVFLSRETTRWVRELTGTIDLARLSSVEELCDELISRLFHAVVGSSRLPLTSVESPLPDFSLGRLGYFHRPAGARPVTSGTELATEALHGQLVWPEKAKLLELLWRLPGPSDEGAALTAFLRRWAGLGHDKDDFLRLLREVFNDVSLSPDTPFVDRVLRSVRHLTATGYLGAADHADFLGYLLRNLGRHLTAYDLITFHHRGANYPDALLLDRTLKALLALVEEHPELFTGPAEGGDADGRRLRRRALRQGWLLRRFYEGLPVPDAPTSPGENARVLPPPYTRVPEAQIADPAQRTKRLFAGDPSESLLGTHGRAVLAQSVADLADPRELRELGTAVFLDRPLGVFKAAGEPDPTPLLSYMAVSRSVAERRLRFLAEAGPLRPDDLGDRLRALRVRAVEGITLAGRRRPMVPGKVSLEDAHQVADDFVILGTTRRSVGDLLAALEPDAALNTLAARERATIIRADAVADAPPGVLRVYDNRFRLRLEVKLHAGGGYVSRGGVEYPARGPEVVAAEEGA